MRCLIKNSKTVKIKTKNKSPALTLKEGLVIRRHVLLCGP